MKREEAQFILTAYRPTGEDAGSPEFAESLQMAQDDPVLKEWFANEQKMDQCVADKLRSVMPPSGLRERILAGGRVSQRVAWYRRPQLLAMAALFAVFALVGGYYLRSDSTKDLAQFAMNYANRGISLEAEGNDLAKLTGWLGERNMPTPHVVPQNLAALEKLGCRTVHFEGRNVSIICFQGDREYHLFVAKKTSSSLFASNTNRQMFSAGKWSSAAWSDSDNDYVLASEGDQQSLERLL